VAAIAAVGASSTVNNASMPRGCQMVPTTTLGVYDAVFNSAASTATCGDSAAPELMGQSELGGLVNMTISHDGTTAKISLSGPDGAWYGVGFNAGAMASLPYAIIVDGEGKVSERKLGSHAPGSALPSSVTVVSSEVVQGIRTMVLTRPVKGASTEHYTIPTVAGEIKMITAVGNTVQLAYHKARTGAKITLVPTEVNSCICSPQLTAYLTYMNTSTAEFSVDCVDEPRSDMLKHGDGTGRDLPNRACNWNTYQGGLRCCTHHNYLTDIAQNAENTTLDTYYLKWRYYFQEYMPPVPATATVPAVKASHQHLHHWVFLIDANVNDYEEDNAHYGQQSIGKIEAHLKASQMGIEDTPKNYSYFQSLVMTPHCHAPSCIREELWNADTNQIICNVSAVYPTSGSFATHFNEANYVSIPPCIFGSQPGLQYPFQIHPDTNILAIKYFNNTFRHLGQMAQWTGLITYDTDTF